MDNALRRNSSMTYEHGSNRFGLRLFCLYILISFLANDVLLPSSLGSISLYLFLGYSLVYVILNKKLKLYPIIGWMAAFIGFSLITMLYSPEKHILSGEYYALIVNLILVLFLSQYTIKQKAIEQIGWAYSISATLLMLMLLLTGNIVDTSVTGRLGTELFGNANILATMLMTATLYTVWLLTYSSTAKIFKVILVLCIVAEYFGMFMSGGRKYIVIPVLFFYILLLFKKDAKGRKHIIKYTLIIAAVVFLIWKLIMNVPTLYEVIGIRMEGLLSFITGEGSNTVSSDKTRSIMIEGGLKKWVESPVWGYGFDSFKHYNRTLTGHFYYSHNNFVELLYNTGIIGFVLYYWYYAKMLYSALNKRIHISVEAKAFIVALILSMLGYEYGAINYNATTMVILLFLASVMARENTLD